MRCLRSECKIKYVKSKNISRTASDVALAKSEMPCATAIALAHAVAEAMAANKK